MIGDLSDDQLVVMVQRLRDDLDELKARQFIGPDSLTMHNNETGASYDRSVTLAPGASTTVTVTFDSDNQDYAFTDLALNAYLSSVAFEIHPGDTGYPIRKISQLMPTALSPKRSQWTIGLTNNGFATFTYLLKFSVQSTDTGAIS